MKDSAPADTCPCLAKVMARLSHRLPNPALHVEFSEDRFWEVAVGEIGSVERVKACFPDRAGSEGAR